MVRTHIRLALGLVAGGLIASPALAAPANIVPYFELGTRYDDNVFRVSGDDEAIATTGTDDTSDLISRAVAGVAAAWPISRQRFVVTGEASEVRYQDFDQLDHSESRLGAAWELQLGSAISGTADIVRTKVLDDFADRASTERDFITEVSPQLELFVEISPRWRLRSLLGYLDVEHSLESQSRFNREEGTGLIELQYAGAPGSTWGLGVELIDGEYPNRPAATRCRGSLIRKPCSPAWTTPTAAARSFTRGPATPSATLAAATAISRSRPARSAIADSSPTRPG